MNICEEELALWGDANRVTFDPAKASKTIISKHEPEGPYFNLMGVWFDAKLTMEHAVRR